MKKIIIASLIIASIALFGKNESAKAFSYPKPVEAMGQIFSDLGISKSELKSTIKTANVARLKKTAPEVKVTFSPANPTEGEKVTANAAATYFMNDASEQYYTWYLKHSYCHDAKKGDNDYESKCDLNQDDKVNIEDYKIEAGRIIANSGFDWEDTDYEKHSDNDGFDAPMGGRDQKGKNAHCYIHDFTDGGDYELSDCEHLFPNTNDHGTIGDGKFGKDEEKFWHTDPQSNDTAGTGNNDEANVAGLGQYQFNWTYQSGDKVGVVVEGISIEPTQYEDSSYKIMWALPKNSCSLDDYSAEQYFDESTYKENETTTSTETFTYCGNKSSGAFKHDDSCTEDDEKTCGSGKDEDCANFSGEKITNTSYRRTKTDNGDNTVTITTYTSTQIYRYESDGTTELVIDGSVSTTNPETTSESDNPITTETLKVKSSGTSTVATGSCITETTSMGFPLETYHSDKNYKETAVTYSSDSTSNTTTATTTVSLYTYYYVDSACSGTPTKKLTSSSTSSKTSSTYNMSSDDLNDCLEKNLISPSEASATQKIGVDLSYSPKEPVNDSNGTNADQITVNASVTGANNENSLKYDWNIYKGDDLSTDTDWKAVTPKKNDEEISLSAVGLSSISFDSTFSGTPKYLKINVKVSETVDKETVKRGLSEIYIKLSNSTDSIKIFQTSVNDSGSLGVSVNNELCKKDSSNSALYNTLRYIVCPITKFSLLRFELSNSDKYSNFSWTMNGKPINDTKVEDICSNCKSRDNKTGAFFPVLDDPGSAYALKLTATKKDTGENVSFTRNLQTVNSAIELTCDKNDADDKNCFPQVLGSFINPTNPSDTYPDLSKVNFDAVADTQYNFHAYFTGNVPKEEDYYWTFDGKKITHDNNSDKLMVDGNVIDWATESAGNNNDLVLKVDTQAYNKSVLKESTNFGKTFIVSIFANLKSSTATNKLLFNNYSVPLTKFESNPIQSTISVHVDYANDSVSLNNLRQKFTASLINSLPAYTLFVLRLSLTIALIMIIVAFAYSSLGSSHKE